MVGKKSGKALLREEGLAKTDNGLPLSTWPQVSMINQKNYYTEYLKNDYQYLANRTLEMERQGLIIRDGGNQERIPASNGVVEEMDVDGAEDEFGSAPSAAHGSKVIVIHVGSQNLRIGLASEALPKTVPMVVARKWRENESEEYGSEPLPKRQKTEQDDSQECAKLFGDDFASHYLTMQEDLKKSMREHKRRVLPNSKELVVNYNKRSAPEIISEHNDPHRIEWTELPADPRKAPDYFTGNEALRIPEQSKPRYKLFWPWRHGTVNERDYTQKNQLFNDFFLIISDAIKTQLGLRRKRDWPQYDCVFVVPDLYEKAVVVTVLDHLMREFSFHRVCFTQESLAASFGGGAANACVVDIGHQKTTICCVDEGMCIEDSRINLKYGGADVTEAFMKMMLFDHFPYQEVNLRRRYDALLANELKHKYCTMKEDDITVQLYDFYLRVHGQNTKKYYFKAYDETLLSTMGFYQPKVFDHEGKLERRRVVMPRSEDLYDGSPNDPISWAQEDIYKQSTFGVPTVASAVTPLPSSIAPTPPRPQPFSIASRFNDVENTPRSSVAGSPVPEDTPQPGDRGSPAPEAEAAANQISLEGVEKKIHEAQERDRILPIAPLDIAIERSIYHGARGDDRKTRDFYGGIMIVGGGAKIPGFNQFLEERLKAMRPQYASDVMVGLPPRELDQAVAVWKGASVFGKLSSYGNDSWIYQQEYDVLGAKLLAQKCMWNW